MGKQYMEYIIKKKKKTLFNVPYAGIQIIFSLNLRLHSFSYNFTCTMVLI